MDDLTLLSESQVAKLLNVSKKTLQTWRLRGCGPKFVKLNQAVRYKKADIEEWIRNKTVKSTSEITARN